MPRIDKENFELLLTKSTMSEEELLNRGIIRKEKKHICVTLSEREARAYYVYCFKHDLVKSEVSRTLLMQGMKEPQKVFNTTLMKAKPRKSHTFLVQIDVKAEFRKFLIKESFELFSESKFMRYCIVNFLIGKGVEL